MYNKRGDIMPKLYMLIGLPSSGKSTWAKTLIQKEPHSIDWHSSDAIREELYGSEEVQDNPNIVFGLMLKRTRESLLAGHSVIYDATNINCKKRRSFLKQISNIDCYKIAKVFATSYDKCIKRNNERSRKVPNNVIERMYRNFQIPIKAEGWDSIDVVRTDYCITSYKDYYNKLPELTHENPHHKLDVKEHMDACYKYFLEKYSLEIGAEYLAYAVAFHDIGKWFCKTYKNSKGDITDVAHFYNHENTGAYDSLMIDFLTEDNLLISQLINWHMRPHEWDRNPALKNKDAEWMTPWFIRALEIIHDCDINND